jgi:phage tail-like protein
MPEPLPVTGLNLRFKVTIDNHKDLGNWWKCDGLTVEFEVHEYKEGGQNDFIHRLPGRPKYSNIRLTRPIGAGSGEVASWLSSIGGPAAGHTAQIEVLDPGGKKVASWQLADVYLAKWTGPSLDVDGKQIAVESLELVHNGFRWSA